MSRDVSFLRKIVFSDEAHFQLSGYVNTQNCRIWKENNPRVIIQSPIHPRKVTVWCGLWFGGIIGPFFFEDENGSAITVNSQRYQDMIQNFVFPTMDDLPGDL